MKYPILISLFWGPTNVQGYYYTPRLACLKSHCQFTNRLKGNSEYISSNSLNLLWAWNKDVGTALQTLRTRLRLYMQHRLKNKSIHERFQSPKKIQVSKRLSKSKESTGF